MDSFLYLGLSNALMATALALPAALVGRFCRRPALAHGLWLLVILKLLTPPLVRVPVLWLSPPALRTPSTAALATVRDSDSEVTGATDVRATFAEGSVAHEPSIVGLGLDTKAPLPPHSVNPVEDGLLERHWTWLVGLVWAIGSVLWLVTISWRVHRFQCLLRGARRAPPDVQKRAHGLAHRLGLARCPGVWFVPGRVSPMVWAPAGPPRLLLPVGLWSQLSDAQRDTLLAHELAHLRRQDHWLRWLELAAVGLYWWHPVAWWAQRELQEAGEQCCDAWVVAVLPGAADAYAEALLQTVAYVSQVRAAVAVGANGAGRVQLLKRRLIMILNGTAPKALSPAGRWAMLVLGAVLLPLWPTWVHSQVSPGSDVSPPEAQVATAGSADEDGAEQITQARAEVDRLSAELERMRARLREARTRLARLEGRSESPDAPSVQPGQHVLPKVPSVQPGQHVLAQQAPPAVNVTPHPRTSVVPAPNIAPAPLVAPAPAAQPAPVVRPRSDSPGRNRLGDAAGSVTRSDRQGGEDYDRRLREVEAKLDRLLEEFRTFRERQPSRSPDPRPH